MNSEHLGRMMAALREGMGRVELDAYYAEGSSSYRVAGENAERANEANERGERRAFLYTTEYSTKLAPQRPRPALSASATQEEVKQLLLAGAKWVGPDRYLPR
jgi:hypothetical protein